MGQTATVGTPSAGDWSSEPMSERVVVRCYSSYRDAKRAVDRLRVASISDRRITVMGRGLRWREAFSTRRWIKTAGVTGALVAAVTAVLLWSVGGLDASFSWLGALLVGGLLGAVVGAAAGVGLSRITRNERTVPETGHVDVEHYDVLVEADVAAKARELLAQ